MRVHGDGGRALAALLAAAVAALLATASPAAAQAPRPDIDRIEVSAARNGEVQFRIVYREAVALPGTTELTLFMDADDDPSTGESGYELAVHYGPGVVSAPYVSLFHDDEPGRGRRPPGLAFRHEGSASTITVPATALGFPSSFTYSFAFYVEMRVGGDVVDAAPSHVLVSAAAKPYDVEASELIGDGPVSFQDLADGTPAEDATPLLWIVGAVLGLGAALGIAGWSVDRLRARSPAARSRTPPDGS